MKKRKEIVQVNTLLDEMDLLISYSQGVDKESVTEYLINSTEDELKHLLDSIRTINDLLCK